MKNGFIFLLLVVILFFAPKAYSSFLATNDWNEAELRIASAIEKNLIVLRLKNLANLESIPETVQDIKGLKRINASGTKIENIESLRGLTELEHLIIRDTRVTDLSPLMEFRNLQELGIGGSWVNDLSPLMDLPRLRWLQMDKTAVKSLCPLTGIRPLNWLNLSSSHAHDGSKDCFLTLDSRIQQLTGGNAYKQNYIPGAQYKAKQSFDHFLQKWEWKSIIDGILG